MVKDELIYELLNEKDGWDYHKEIDIYVSIDGMILSGYRPSNGWTTGGLTTTGYYTTGDNNLVHRLVAMSFIPNPCNKPHINHIDNNPRNNKVDNLEWCTPKENHLHSMKQGRMEHCFELNRPHCSIEVHQYTKSGMFVCTYASCMEAQRETGISNANINKVINGDRRTAGGFKWLQNKLTKLR